MQPVGEVCTSKDLLDIKPRIPINTYVPPPAEWIRIDWSLPISLFKDYKFDNEVIYIVEING